MKKYFCWSPLDGMSYWDTENDAEKEAQEALDVDRAMMGPRGSHFNISSICYGQIIGESTLFNDGDGIDYQLERLI
jgi:hypothetical protein